MSVHRRHGPDDREAIVVRRPAGHPVTTIEVFADVACPFTHVGLRRFVEQREQLGRHDVELVVRAWPLEIVNGRPLDPAATAAKVADMRHQVAPTLFAGFSEENFPSTSLPALALAAAAYARDVGTGEAVSLELRDLLFERGEDIADPEVLGAVAEEHAITVGPSDVQKVRDDHVEGVRRWVIGSPHFFTPVGDFFCPALRIDHDPAGHLEMTVDVETLDRFLTACFG